MQHPYLAKIAAELTAKGRNQINEGNFALPGRRYPIHDMSHARNALARVAQHGTAGERTIVRAAVESKYPSLKKSAEVEYRGHTFPGYNQPIRSTGGGQHKMMVLAKKGDDVKLVRFGHRGYSHNYSPEAKANYLKRSAGIRDGSGNLTKDDKFSANYWARKHLWPRNQEADGSALKKQAAAENYRHRATILLRNKDGHILATPKPAFTTMQFPGGGIHEDERFDMPTEAEIFAGARREAREELGHDLVNLRYIGALRNAMDARFRERQTLKRGVPIHGLHEHYVVAEPGARDRRAYGAAGDKFGGRYMPLDDILWHMDKDSRGISEGAEHAAREAALLRKHFRP